MYPMRVYVKYLPNAVLTVVGFLLNLAAWIWPLWQLRVTSGEQIFLHYNILYGVDYVGEWWRVLYLPSTGLLILLTNFIMGWFLFHKDKFAAYSLNAVSVICQIFLLIAVALLVFLNI
jgi:hypothetical protein